MPPARLKARMDSLLSFPVGLFHPLQHAGLSRRSPVCRPSESPTVIAHLDILVEVPYVSPRMSTKEQEDRIELLQGTLDLFILRTLLLGPVHGHAIAKAIEFNSDECCRSNRGRSIRRCTGSSSGGWISVRGGYVGKQPPGQVLPADAQGPTATGGRDEQVGQAGGSHRADSPARPSGKVNHETPQANARRSRPGHSRPHRGRDRGQHRARHDAGGSALCGDAQVRQRRPA